MLKTYLYIPDHINEKIDRTAKAQKKAKAEVIRQALEEGLSAIEKKKSGGAESLLKLAEIGRRANFKGPRDSSTRIDELLWGKNWNRDE